MTACFVSFCLQYFSQLSQLAIHITISLKRSFANKKREILLYRIIILHQLQHSQVGLQGKNDIFSNTTFAHVSFSSENVLIFIKRYSSYPLMFQIEQRSLKIFQCFILTLGCNKKCIQITVTERLPCHFFIDELRLQQGRFVRYEHIALYHQMSFLLKIKRSFKKCPNFTKNLF